MILTLLAAIAGGIGATARYTVEVLMTDRLPHSWTRLLVINLSGSALLGLVTGLTARGWLSADAQLVLGSGVLGGYTTFSAASVATVLLAEERRWPATVLSSVGMLLGAAAVGAAGLGVGLSL